MIFNARTVAGKWKNRYTWWSNKYLVVNQGDADLTRHLNIRERSRGYRKTQSDTPLLCFTF